ncbi:MAG: 50S ribosomal protein L23 [Planctomycetes bacterium]|nr:50S ribosomal protein L23 [Planctomycetota bacterium]
MDMYNVIIRPLITEKGTHQSSRLNAYAFEVHRDANKAQIKVAVEKIYQVKVMDVRTANRKGKPRNSGAHHNTTKAWKKAVVVLDDVHHIDLF